MADGEPSTKRARLTQASDSEVNDLPFDIGIPANASVGSLFFKAA